MKNRTDTGSASETPEQLVEHISRLMGEAEAMLAGPIADQAQSKLADIKERLEQARERLTDVYSSARKSVIAGANYTDEAIRANPYQSVGIALGVGVLLGVIIGRSTNNR